MRFYRSSSSRNVHTGIDFEAFAEWWNDQVEANETAGRYNAGIFRKTTGILQQYHKERQRLINVANTIAAHDERLGGTTVRDASSSLRTEHRRGDRDTGHCQQPSVPQLPPETTTGNVLQASFGYVTVPTMVTTRSLYPIPMEQQPIKVRKVSKKPLQNLANTTKDPFCRRCGWTKGENSPFGGKYHMKGRSKHTREFCKVPSSKRKPAHEIPEAYVYNGDERSDHSSDSNEEDTIQV
mmetsp:Transcript_3266/g.4046  ORF Transcript_3266/g.4046 Transcript_3266/m.4046 type:complete len:238 (+) Transcript_3266:34-747(+)